MNIGSVVQSVRIYSCHKGVRFSVACVQLWLISTSQTALSGLWWQ